MKSVGQLLKAEREKKGLSLRGVEKSIRIREKFLKAIEEGAWDVFSSRIYVIGIVKNYSKHLGLDTEKMTAFFRRDYEKKDEPNFRKRVSSYHLIPQTRKLIIVGIISLVIIFLGYFVYQLINFLSPPKITILSPRGEYFRSTDRITILGKTERESSISIFGEKVYPNSDGAFEYDFPLHQGNNELVIEVVGANGKKSVLKKNYFKE